jgi:hypothetical protein
MNVLVLAPNYPCPGYCFSGIFNEKSARALTKLCDRVAVLVPCPYVPPLAASFVPRWKVYADVPRHEITDGISVYRPMIPVIPRVAQAFWADRGAFLCCRRLARTLHDRTRFDAIISFDLAGSGGFAWRLARDLDLPATGWATGDDVRVAASSAHGRSVIRALKNLDLVFYQSHELLEKAAGLLGVSPQKLSGNRHVVLPRGIPEPPQLAKTDVRNRLRASWGIKPDEVVVLYLGRVSRQKGVLELLEAFKLAAAKNSRLKCVLVGCKPEIDETSLVEQKLRDFPWLGERVMLLPECRPSDVWENLCGADIFVFPSHNEGMPNSLLEALAMGIPAIAFAIPAVEELEAGSEALVLVPPLDLRLFADAILRLAASPDECTRRGEKGRALVTDRFMVHKSMAKALAQLTEVIQKRTPEKAQVHLGTTTISGNVI